MTTRTHISKPTSLLFSFLFLLIGSGALYAAYRLHQSQERARDEGLRVSGEIVAVEKKIDSKRRVSYAPRVRFTASDGQQIEFVSSVSGMKRMSRIGKKVEVIYDPREPTKAEIDSLLHRWLAPGIAGLFGIIFLAVGLSAFRPAKADEA